MITITGEAKEIAELVEALKRHEPTSCNTGSIILTGGDNCQHGIVRPIPSLYDKGFTIPGTHQGSGSISLDKDGNTVNTTYKADRKIIEVIYKKDDSETYDEDCAYDAGVVNDSGLLDFNESHHQFKS
jgi:organic radical activating enzyme